jgi:hypothetical protein
MNQTTTEQPKHNLKYEDIADIVEYLVRTKSSSYSFDCYTPEDIAQEIRIICFRSLDKLDLERVKDGKLQNFFGRCVDNGLKNLKRDNYVRASSPYKKKFEQLEDEDKSEEAEFIREKWQHHQNNIKRRLAIKHAVPIDGLSELINNDRFQKEMEYKDLERYLLEAASDDIIIPLKLILNGKIAKISRNEKRRVQQFVKKLLGQYQ